MIRLFNFPLVVLDTETTGFPEQAWSRVVEVAAVRLDVYGQEESTFAELVRPEIHDYRAAGAEGVHGLTRKALADARLAGEVGADLFDWLDGAKCTAFNVAFDAPMLARMGVEILWGPCVMLRAMEVMGPAGVLRPADPRHPRFVEGRPWLWPSLKDAAAFFGVPPQEPAHRALSDAWTAALVAVEIQRRTVVPISPDVAVG